MADAKGDLLQWTPAGLYCAAGDFHIDPARKVERAVITHAHSDHARTGSSAYLCAEPGRDLLAARVGASARIETLPYGRELRIGAVRLSLHPAGHILGSAQVRVAGADGVWVVTGDYNANHANPTCAPFAALRCDVLVTESTFALPVYRWPDPAEVFAAINAWWQRNQTLGLTSVLPAYPLGKTQRLLAGIDPSIGPIAVHGGARPLLDLYAAAGVDLPPTLPLTADSVRALRGRGLLIHSSMAAEPAAFAALGPCAHGQASGWMLPRAARRRPGAGAGFVLSDHSDWDGLLQTVRSSGAARILVQHGAAACFARHLCEQGLAAAVLTEPPAANGGTQSC
jgi:putative mRNA 3-end processing factor